MKRVRKPKVRGEPKNDFERNILNNCNFGNVEYETEEIPYKVLEEHVYIPDFVVRTLDGSKIYVEAKGWLRPEHMKKMRAVKECNPELDIRFVFQRDNKVQGARKMKYSQWAEKYGFPWAIGLIPVEWLR